MIQGWHRAPRPEEEEEEQQCSSISVVFVYLRPILSRKMGNGQSSHKAYHPSAVGYSPGNTDADDAARFANTVTSVRAGPRSPGRNSLAGPMRSRARDGNKQKASKRTAGPVANLEQDKTSEEASKQIPTTSSPQNVFLQPRTEFSFENLDRINAERRAAQLAASLQERERGSDQQRGSPPASSLGGSSSGSSHRREHRISAEPRHPSIAEVPEQVDAGDADSTRAGARLSSDTVRATSGAQEDDELMKVSDHGHAPEMLPEPLALALKTGLGKHYLAQGMAPAEAAAAAARGNAQYESMEEMNDAASAAATHVSRVTNDSGATYRELLPAYWRMEESRRTGHGSHGSTDGTGHHGLGLGLNSSQDRSPRDLSPTQKESRRHSWASSTGAVAAEPTSRSVHEEETAVTTPRQKVKGNWTSYWEDRRGQEGSQESLEDKMNEVYATPQGEISKFDSRFSWDDSDEQAETTGEEGESEPSQCRHFLSKTISYACSPLHSSSTDPQSSTTNKLTSGSGPSRTVRRKPVPSLRISHEEQRTFPPAPAETKLRMSQSSTLAPSDLVYDSKRQSHISGASNTTEALINHVERLRAGPKFQIDPTASSLLTGQPQTPSASAENAQAGLAQPSESPSANIGKRPRAMSLLALIKGRVRKASDAGLTTSPSPSKNEFQAGTTPSSSPSASRDVHLHSNASRALYAQPRLPSEGALVPRSASSPRLLQTPRAFDGVSPLSPMGRPASNSSLRSRSNRSARSSRSRRSTSTTSLRAQAVQAKHAASTRKAATPSASSASKSSRGGAVPATSAASSWWKPAGGWGRKGSVAVTDESSWIDEREDATTIADTISASRGGADDKSKKSRNGQKDEQGSWSKSKVPFAVTEDPHLQNEAMRSTGAGDMFESPTDSFVSSEPVGLSLNDNFTSLVKPPHPAPVPPKRPRKQRRANSSSTDDSASPVLQETRNGHDEASETMGVKAGRLSLSPFGGLRDHEDSAVYRAQSSSPPLQGMGRISVELAGMAAFIPAVSPSSSSSAPRESLSMDDGKSDAELGQPHPHLESDDDKRAKDTVAAEDVVAREVDVGNAGFWTPGVVRRPRPLPPLSLSPVQEMKFQESPHTTYHELQGSGHRRTTSQTHSRSSSSGLPTPTVESHRRPLPAPPVIAQPRTNPIAAERATSTSASPAMAAAWAQLDGKRSVKSLQKHPGHDSDGGIVGASQADSLSSQASSILDRPRNDTMPGGARRPLPPTPQMAMTRASRSASMPSKPAAPFAASKRVLGVSSEANSQNSSAGLAMASPTEAAGSSPQESPMLTTPKVAIRESWMSTDGPWSAVVVAAEGRHAAPKGLASAQRTGSVNSRSKTIRRVRAQDLSPKEPKSTGRPWSSSAPIHPKEVPEDADETLSTQHIEPVTGSDPVPFAETAVQASLAALAALERSSESTSWRSRWAREKLLGASQQQLEPPSSYHAHGHESSMEPSISELSDLSNARPRRRAAPYSTRREARKSGDSVSSQESRSDRHRRRKSSSKREARSRKETRYGHHAQDGSGLATLNDQSNASVADENNYSSSASEFTSQLRRLDPKRLQQHNSWSTAHSVARNQNVNSLRRLEEAERRQRAWDDLAATGGSNHDDETAAAAAKSDAPSALKRPPIPSFEVSPPVGQEAEARTQRKPSASEWDETVVPALQKRLELEAAEEARFRLSSVEGQARASSELLVASPTTPTTPPPDNVPSPSASPARRVTQLQKEKASFSPRRGDLARAALSRHEHDPRSKGGQFFASSSLVAPSELAESSAAPHHHKDRSQARSKKSHNSSSKKSKRHNHGASSSTSSRLRQGYGRDDIQAWQASLGMALASSNAVVE